MMQHVVVSHKQMINVRLSAKVSHHQSSHPIYNITHASAHLQYFLTTFAIGIGNYDCIPSPIPLRIGRRRRQSGQGRSEG